jgi:hypothetical protein
LFRVITSLFVAEEVIRNSESFLTKISLPLTASYSSKINSAVEELIAFLFSQSIEVRFVEEEQTHLLEPDIQYSDGYTCLFSGGIDSLAGILLAKEKYGKTLVGALTKHPDQQFPKVLVNALEKDRSIPIHVREIIGPKHHSYNRLLRGMLYFSNALMLGNTNIIICEIGPTMYQPRFTLLDEVSMTTHPHVLSLAKQMAEEILGVKITIVKPNENLTKAEVGATIDNADYVSWSCSCRRTRFANSDKPNCGMCYGCAIRRFGLAVAGIKDWSYKNKDMTSSKLESFDEVLQVLKFSLDFLEDRDGMPRYQIDNIRRYNKEDIFERFSLDNIAGLWLLNQQSKLKDSVFQTILEASQDVITKERLKERVASVKEGKFKPDFGNLV